MSPGSRAAHLPPSVGQLLHEFRDSFGFDASVWVREEGGWELALTTGPLHASALPEDGEPAMAADMDTGSPPAVLPAEAPPPAPERG